MRLGGERLLTSSALEGRRAALGAALLLFSAWAGAGCGSATPAAHPSAPASCAEDRFPYPSPAARLTAADAGRTVTVPVGGLLEITLLGRDHAGGWPELSMSGEALQALVQPAAAATVGTRLAELCAVRPGTARIESDGWDVQVRVP